MDPSADQIAATLDQIGADGVGLQANRNVLTKRFLSQLRKKGYRIPCLDC